MLGSDIGEHSSGRYMMKGDLAALDQLADEEESYRATCLVRELLDRLAMAAIDPVLSQFTGIVLKELQPSSPKKLLR